MPYQIHTAIGDNMDLLTLESLLNDMSSLQYPDNDILDEDLSWDSQGLDTSAGIC